MKPVAIILVLLAVVALAGVGFLYTTATVDVVGMGCAAMAATDQSEVFESLKSSLTAETFVGTRFSDTIPENAEDWQFYTYTIRLRNDTFLLADVVELQVTPMDGDILQIGNLTPSSLPARSTGDFTATILSPISLHHVREITVTWYIWGLPFRTKVVYSR